ncbi:MAG: cytochrome c biogenesis protein ResB [Rickettsiales bacterium]|nr:cytochrome c biogenesis protein ResB [Rickettsiales bacterium]
MQTRLKTLSSPAIIFYVMPYLMVLLILGTLAQRAIGLYEAERLFFASWVVWYGPIPMPGVYLVLSLITIPLFIKTVFATYWSWRNAGIILTHIGALLLLLGGVLTSLTAQEGYVALGAGDKKHIVSDYHAREFVVIKDDEVILQLPHHDLHDEMVLQAEAMPFDIRIVNYCRNCMPTEVPESDTPRHHIAARFDLKDANLMKQDEENQTGAMLYVTGASDEIDGIYIAFESLPHPSSFELGGATYQLAMRRTERELPFAISLQSVEKFTHPGSEMAREYQSAVTIHEQEDIEYSSLIRMNEPLRIQGYTLYQASLAQERDRTVSVLAVVKNDGWLFPYISSFVIGVGLIWHSITRMKERDKRMQEEQ